MDDVTVDLRRGEVLGLVGESGSGKTTLGRTILGLVSATEGSVEFEGREITKMNERQLRAVRREMQIIFQDPHASLNPAMTVQQLVEHPLQIHKLGTRAERRSRVAETLSIVGLDPPEQFMEKYPSDLSGGQKQRVVIARAIILNPVLLVADEPVSMLDMSVRAKILELMLYLKRQLNLTYLYITHDLATAKFFCDRIAILYLGRIVEIGPSTAIYADPKHPYTRALLRAIPDPDPRRTVPRDLPPGEVPDAARPPLGCSFHPRCPLAFEVCGWESRDLRDFLEARWATQAQDAYEAEQAVMGDLALLDEPMTDVRLKAGDGKDGRRDRRSARVDPRRDSGRPVLEGPPADGGGRPVRTRRVARADRPAPARPGRRDRGVPPLRRGRARRGRATARRDDCRRRPDGLATRRARRARAGLRAAKAPGPRAAGRARA